MSYRRRPVERVTTADPGTVAMKTFTGSLGGAEESWRPE
jgi:hypothetical protein